MVVGQGEVWWVDLPPPLGSEAGFRRPVVVVQADAFTRHGLKTIVSVPLTSSLLRERSPGCVPLSAEATGLPKPSVALAYQMRAVDRSLFVESSGRLSPGAFQSVLDAIDEVLGR